MFHRDDNGIASLYLLLLTIKYKDAFTLNEGLGFASVKMNLIADVLALLECDALGEAMAAIGIIAVIQHAIGSPASFLVHWTWS